MKKVNTLERQISIVQRMMKEKGHAFIDVIHEFVEMCQMFHKYIEGAHKNMPKNFIKDAIKKPGALRASLDIKKGQKIPAKKLEKATHSKNPTTKKRAVLAETLKKMRK